MTIQDQAPDLSICQEAQKKGVEIESNFKWYKFSLSDIPTLQLDPDENFAILSGELKWKYFAPLTDEILEKLPAVICDEDFSYSLKYEKNEEGFNVYYEACDIQKYLISSKKLSNALYLLYMKLKSEGII